MFGEDKSLASTHKSGGADQAPDMFGFRKTLVLLTHPGKVVAMSAQDGGIMWTYFDPQEKALNVLVEHKGSFDDIVDIVVISENALSYLNPFTGVMRTRVALERNLGSTSDFILVNTSQTDKRDSNITNDDQVLVSIPRTQSESGSSV